MQDDFDLPSLPKVSAPNPPTVRPSPPPILPPPENRALAVTSEDGKDLTVSGSAEDSLAQIASSITDLVEIQIENRDLVSEQTDMVKKDHVIDATESREESKGKTSVAEEDDRDFKQKTADTLSKVASQYDSFKEGIREVADVAMSPTVLLDKIPDLLRWGAGKLRGDSEDNDAFDPQTVLNRMSEVREDLAKATEQHSEKTEQVLQEEVTDAMSRLVEDSPLVESLDRLTDTLQDTDTSPINSFWGTDIADAEFSYVTDTESPVLSNVLSGTGIENPASSDVFADVYGAEDLITYGTSSALTNLGVTGGDFNPANNLNIPASPNTLPSEGRGGTTQNPSALLGQAVNFLRQMSVRGTKSSPVFTYLLDYDQVAGEEGLYESLDGQDFQADSGFGDGGDGSGPTDKAGKAGSGGAGNFLGDMKWIAISAAIIALADPIDKLVTAMTDPDTGFGKIVNAIGGFAESMLAEDGPIMKLVNAITDMVTSLAGPVTDFLVMFVEEVGPPLAKIAGLLADTLLEGLTTVINGLKKMVTSPDEFWSDMANAVISGFTSFFNEFVGQIGDAIANGMGLGLNDSQEEQVDYLLDMGFNHSQARDLVKGKDIQVKDGSQFGLGEGPVMIEAIWDKTTQSHTFNAVDVATYRNYGSHLKGEQNIGKMSEGQNVTTTINQTVYGIPGAVLAPS